MVEFRNELLKEFPGISLPGALLFDYPTAGLSSSRAVSQVHALRDYIYEALMNS